MATEGEVVHLAYRRPFDSETGKIPPPRHAVCAGDAVGPMTYDVDEMTCMRCEQEARIRRWWDLETRPLWFDQLDY